MKHRGPAKSIAFDKEGYILNESLWNDSVALLIAHRNGIDDLTDKHWHIIHTLHQYYERYHSVPGTHYICHMHHISEREFSDLFSHGLKEACQISGIPNPGEEVKAYM